MTKRLGYIITDENVTEELCKAAIKCAAKKKTKRYSVRRVLNNLDSYAKKLRRLILDGTYKPSPYKECHIVDRGSNKHRVLHKPKFFPTHTLLRKRNALHFMRTARKWRKHKTPFRARSLLSRIGNTKWYASKNFKEKYLKGINRKELIRYANRRY